MEMISICRFRIVTAPLTGIGWVAVQEWDNICEAYTHISSHRTKAEADSFIAKYEKNAE